MEIKETLSIIDGVEKTLGRKLTSDEFVVVGHENSLNLTPATINFVHQNNPNSTKIVNGHLVLANKKLFELLFFGISDCIMSNSKKFKKGTKKLTDPDYL